MSEAYYRDDLVTLYHGDCREILPNLPANSVDLVMTDPPFSVPVKYQDSEGVYPRSWGDLEVMEPFFREVFKGIRRVVRDTGQVYVNCDGESYPVFYKVTYSMWPQSKPVIWYKPTGRRGRGWQVAHELVLHLRTPQTQYGDGWRQDVIGIMPVRTLNRRHPAEKPGQLWDFLAEGVPNLRTTVALDPFVGGGSMLVWAKTRGLRVIGCEREESWCEVAADAVREVIPFAEPSSETTGPETPDLFGEAS